MLARPVNSNIFIRTMDKIFKNSGHFYCEKVNDSLYRGSQAAEKEFPKLAQQGIKSILNLKSISYEEAAKLSIAAEKYGINYINIPLNPFNINKTLPFIKKAISSADKKHPMFVHCTYGQDRTGFVSALAKLKNGCNLKAVVKEMHDFGFKKTLFFGMENFLKKTATNTEIYA